MTYVNEPQRQAEILNNLSIPPFYSDEISETLRILLLKLLEDCNEFNLNNQKVKTLRNLAGISIKRRKLVEAKNYFDQALRISESFDYELDKAYIYNNLAMLFYKEGKLESAIKALKKSLTLSKKYNIVPLIIDGHKFLGKVYKKEKAYDKSYHYYREALDYYQRISGKISSIEQKEQFRMSFQHLPEIIEELNNLIDSRDIEVELNELLSIQNISKEICSTANRQFNNFIKEACRRCNNKQNLLIKRLREKEEKYKGPRLETDARILFRREYSYSIEDSGRNFKIEIDDIDLLINEGCQKDKSTKSFEIDIYGKKEESNRNIYIIGECKNRNRVINTNEMKCFILKANLIAQIYLDLHEKQGDKKPFFHLIIVSLQGFPSMKIIKELLDNYWIPPKGRLNSRSIELIDRDRFIRLLKKNNLPMKIYKDF